MSTTSLTSGLTSTTTPNNLGVTDISTNDPFASQVEQASIALEEQTEQDQLAELSEQSQMERLQSEMSIRTAIAEAMHAIANQAISLSQQFIGDEISQVKKGLENAGKAV
jgi:hypothetical protein